MRQIVIRTTMVKTKICGITRLEDALASCRAGADALGFNFSRKSPRSITPERVAAIIDSLPPFVSCAGIFVEHSPAEINAICQQCRLHVAQLHSETYTAAQALAIEQVKIIRVFRPESGFDTAEVHRYARESGVRTFLFDAYRPGMEGGTGERIRQDLASRIFDELRDAYSTILAGGLNPDNVAEAVRLTLPYAVDTASGVETSPGIKNADRIRTFVTAAHAN